MRKILFLFSFCILVSINAKAQFCEPKQNAGDPSLPVWVKMMYAGNSDVYAVDSAYRAYYREHDFLKTTYTQYYKRWRRVVEPYIDATGYVVYPDPLEREDELQRRLELRNIKGPKTGSWTFAGPELEYKAKYAINDSTPKISEQANTYSIDQSLTNTDILFAGTESGGVYKSTDKGHHWSYVTPGLMVTDVRAVKIHPANPDIVLIGGNGKIYITTDGGITWAPTGNATFQAINIHSWDFYFNPVNPNMVFAATDHGLFRSLDACQTWTNILPNECMCIIKKPGNPAILYTIQFNPTLNISQFYKSTDTGTTFLLKTNGWFTVPSADSGLIESTGGKLAVSAANPEKIYALVVGSSQAAANLQLNGFIGVYVSDDAGENWTLPHGLIGAPYNLTTHPNLMTFSGDNNSYNQIYYNTTIAASQLDENRIILGGLSLWRSDDHATSYQAVGGYVGSVPNLHVDMQDIISVQTSPTTEEVWVASDGGVNYSTDFVDTHVSRTVGIYAGEFWGFDQGWEEDIMVGGRYHNGNAGFNEGFPQKEFIALGGGEASTGYVNYSDEKKTYFSDIGGRVLPAQPDGLLKTFNLNVSPNEGYWLNESSRILFDQRYWNVAYLGKDNAFYKSTDGGSSFAPIYTFTGTSSDKVLWIEQCLRFPDVMYLQQIVNDQSRLYVSTDDGISWAAISIPQTNKRYLFFTVSATNQDEIWLAYTDGANGQKIYHTLNAGASWINLTTTLLNGHHIYTIVHQAGTNGGVYIATREGGVFYRNTAMSDWAAYSSGLPVAIEPLRLVPYYKGQKVKLATKNISIWESDFYETSLLMADFSADFAEFYCPGDTVHFVDHSVATSNATYAWTFTGGSPPASTLRNPKVVYSGTGPFKVRLIVSDGSHSDTITKTAVVSASGTQAVPISEGFESGFFQSNWKFNHPSGGANNWSINNNVGGFGQSSKCMYFNNFDIDAKGNYDEIWTAKYNLSSLTHARLCFDVAYVPYGGQYSDTLAIRGSRDCGQNFMEMYVRGGVELSTGPAINQIFIPTATQWRKDTIDLSFFAGQPEVLIAFQNRGHWGQAMYVDNINLFDPLAPGINDIETGLRLNLDPNPNRGIFNLSLDCRTCSSFKYKIVNTTGQVLREEILATIGNGFRRTIDLSPWDNGVYYIQAIIDGKMISRKIIVVPR